MNSSAFRNPEWGISAWISDFETVGSWTASPCSMPKTSSFPKISRKSRSPICGRTLEWAKHEDRTRLYRITPGSIASTMIRFAGDSALYAPPVNTTTRSNSGTRYTFCPPLPESMIVSTRR